VRKLAALLLLAHFAAWPIAAAANVDRTLYYETQLLSRAADGGFPDGPSRNAVISQDERYARTIAYESDASNIVAGDANGLTDVFVVDRAAGYTANGSPWRNGTTRIASRGLDGPANGRSYGPAVSGDAGSGGRGATPPRCVAFVSEASNLVADDTNGRADAFVYWLGTGRLQRVSVANDGAQADGATYDVAVDGDCTHVAFSSDAANLAQTATPRGRPNYGGVLTRPAPPGVKQVYVRIIGEKRPRDRALVGLTYLASSSSSGAPGDADSSDPSWSLRTDQVLSFSSRAGNLDPRDGNGVEDVYVSASSSRLRRFGKGKGAVKLAWLDPRTRVVSVNPRTGRAGNGPSAEGRASDLGCSVVFSTQASDLIAGDGGPTSDIARADLRGFLLRQGILGRGAAGCRLVTRGSPLSGDRILIDGVARGNGPSVQPESAGGGNYVVFASAADRFAGTGALPTTLDANGATDAFMWTGRRNVIDLESATSARYARQLALPSSNPFPSQRINYVLFETSDPFADLGLVQSIRSAWMANPQGTLSAAQANPAFHQVYLRYLGGRDPTEP
jgi:hypothetical protein